MTISRIPSVEGGIQPTLLSTTGDIMYASSASNPARLAIGSSAQVLTVASGIPSWATPAANGKVLQVVQATDNTYYSSSSATYTNTLLTATITPTLNTSKILVMITHNACSKTATNSLTRLNLKLVRGSTDIYMMNDIGLYSGTALQLSGFNWSAQYLDSPATTSATTYKTMAASGGSLAEVRINDYYTAAANTISSIILMEIGA